MEESEKKIAAWIYNNTWVIEPLFIVKLRTRFSPNEIADFLEIMDSYCHGCWHNEHPCFCQRDD